MATHYFPEDRVHFTWDAGAEPVITIAEGDTVVINTRDVSDNQIGPDSDASVIDGLNWEDCVVSHARPAALGPSGFVWSSCGVGCERLDTQWLGVTSKFSSLGHVERGERKTSELKGASRQMVKTMTETELAELASAKRKGKPAHVSRN